MFKSYVSRRHIARTLSTLVAVALTVTVGCLSANGAAATQADAKRRADNDHGFRA